MQIIILSVKSIKKIETQDGWFEKDQNDARESETSSFFYY